MGMRIGLIVALAVLFIVVVLILTGHLGFGVNVGK